MGKEKGFKAQKIKGVDVFGLNLTVGKVTFRLNGHTSKLKIKGVTFRDEN